MGENAGPDCRQCKHVGRVPGETNVCCQHPMIEITTMDALCGAMGAPCFSQIAKHRKDFGLKIDETAMMNGQAAWPINYDPIWVSGCRKFEEREE